MRRGQQSTQEYLATAVLSLFLRHQPTIRGTILTVT
jgi:hypothetical protein